MDSSSTPPPRARQRPSAWIALTVLLGLVVIGLAVWVAVLQSRAADADESAARIAALEQENAELAQELEAERAAGDVRSALDAARAEILALAEELGAQGEAQAALLAEAALRAAAAEIAGASTEDLAAAEACLAATADAIRGLSGSDDVAGALAQMAEDLQAIPAQCESPK